MRFRVRQGEIIHKRPDLGTIELELDIKDNTEVASLNVIVRFNEDESSTILGMLRYQLKRATVHIDFSGCTSCWTNPLLESNVILSSKQNYEFEVSASDRGSTDTEAGEAIEISIDGRPKFSESNKRKEYNEKTEVFKNKTSFEDIKAHVFVSGTKTALRFSFESPNPSLPLRGAVTPTNWCDVQLSSKYGKISARLNVADRDIHILGVGGIWPNTFSPNKSTLLRLLALRFLDYGPNLSETELHLHSSFLDATILDSDSAVIG